MSNGNVITRSTYFFVKGSKLTKVKPFFQGLSHQNTMHMLENLKKTKTTKLQIIDFY